MVDSAYFKWLVEQVRIEETFRDREYDGLFLCLDNKEFVWIVPNDDNRIVDAQDLRREFWGEGRTIPQIGVSVLEVIVALSRRLEFNADGDRRDWAWQIIKNLKLHRMWDPLSNQRRRRVEDTLERLVWRTYNNDGEGGFFPLRNPEADQTKVEIWYQMNAYINEHVMT